MTELVANKKREKLHYPIIFIGLFLCFVFTCNHNALFISDYYIFLFLYIISAFIYMWMKNVPLRLGYQQKIIILLSLELLVLGIVNKQYMDRGVLLSYIAWFGFYFCALMMPCSKSDIKLIINSFIIGAIACSLLVLIIKHEYIYEGSGRYTIQFFNNEEIDPNYLAEFLIIGGALSVSKLLLRKKTLLDIILLVAGTLIITIAIFYTGSRAGVLAYIVSLFGIFIKLCFNNRDMISIRKVIVFMTIAIVVLIIVALVIPREIYDRIFEMNLNDGSNSLRVQHWLNALKCWSMQPIFGYGPALTKELMMSIMNHNGDAHNTYLTLLLQFGLVGFLMFFLLFIDVLKGLFNKENLVFLFILLGQVMASFIIANHLGISLWMTLLLCNYVSREYKEKRKEGALK